MKEYQWLDAGYKIFALEGLSGLKVEVLSRIVGKSKSSFYHLFADMEVFQERLLAYHLKKATEIALQAKEKKRLVPDQLLLMVEHKEDFLFNRRLRIHRENKDFQKCYEQCTALIVESIKSQWADNLNFSAQPEVAKNILMMTIDIFFQRITNENFTYEWLVGFLNEIKSFIRNLIANG